MEGSDSRRAPRPAETVGKMERRRLRCAERGDGRGRFFLLRPRPCLAPRLRPPTAKFIEGKKANLWRRRDNGAHSLLPPSLPFSLNTHSLETKGITGERTRIGKEKEGRGDFGASPLMVLTSAGSE